MSVTPRSPLVVVLGCVLLTLLACRGTRRISAPGPTSTTCLPPLEAPAPVGTAVGEASTKDFILRVHDVRDILDLMPVVQLVGPRGTRTVPPEDALIARLLQELDSQERTITEIHATDSGAVVVKATLPLQEHVARALHGIRLELVGREVAGDPPPVRPQPSAPAADR